MLLYLQQFNISMRKAWVVILLLFWWLAAPAQADTTRRPDSTLLRDSTARQQDSVGVHDSLAQLFQNPIDTPKVVVPAFSLFLDSSIYNHSAYFSFTHPVMRLASRRNWQGKESLFYSAIALLIFFSLVRNNFSRYATDLFALFFRTTIKQRQIKEQLLQAPLPSLLLNILFFISGALFINLLLAHYGFGQTFNFWLLFLYAVIGLVVIYLLKFITLKLCGWLFHMSDVTDSYTFIVFTTNKIIGIALLPFIILLSFTTGLFQQGLFTLSITVIVALFLYRFYLSFVTIERQLNISAFHFLLYLVGFEIVPLLLINKLLFRFLGETP